MRPALVLAGLVGVASPVLIQPIHAHPPAHPGAPAADAVAFVEAAPAAESEPLESTGADSAGAAAGESPAAPPEGAEPVATYREGLVVTATLDEEERERIPASISVIDAAEIEARQATGAVELLRTVPGVAVVRSGSPGKVTSLFVRGAASTQTLVLWNGLRLNDPMFGGYDWAFLPTEGVERIEVVRGPFSALYGGDAAGGVIQVLTGRQRGVSVRLEGGEEDYRRGALAAGFGGGPSYFEDLHLDLTGHLRRGEGELVNDFFDGDEATARLTYEPRSGVSLGLLARAADADVGVPLGGFGGTPTPNQTNRRESRELTAPFRIDRAEWEVEGHAGWFGSDVEAEDPDDPFVASVTDAETAVARAVATWRPAGLAGGGDLWIAGGGEWQEQEASTESAFSSLDGVSQRTRAAFAQGHLQLPRWTFEAGLRHDDSDRFGGETSARLGAVAALGRSLRLHGSYGEAFRPPTLSDLFLPVFGNPALEPEVTASWEAGIDGDAGLSTGRLTWGVTGFATDFENLIVFNPPTFQAANVGRAESRGIEASAAWTEGRFQGRLDATWLDAENLDTGEPLVRRPEESASAVVTWAPAPWTLSAVGRYVGDRPDLGGVTLPSYAVADLAAAWAARPWLEPYARVENLLDEEYEEVDGFPAPSRTLVGGVALRF